MNFKHLIIVSLILATLTIGVVSASDDIASDAGLSQSDADDTQISETHQNAVSQEIDEENNDMASYSDDSSIEDQQDLLGKIDDEPALEATEDGEDILGYYNSGGVEVKLYNDVDITTKYNDIGYVYDDNGLKGTVTVKIDGKKVYTKKYTSGTTYSLYLTVDDLNLKKYGYGYHTVKLTYNDGKEKSDYRKVNFIATPTVDYPSIMAEGEKNGITISGDKMKGKATVYNREPVGTDEYGDTTYKRGAAIKTVDIKDGYGWIQLNKLPEGTHHLQLEYTFGTYSDVETFTVHVQKNSAGFKSSISADEIKYGKTVTVKLKGPKGTDDAYIYIDNDYYSYQRFNYGSMKEIISGLDVGRHRITVSYSDDSSNLFYSATYKLWVKHDIKLSLKKVKVKKSAKKLTIKATLKVDGKLAKNKKLKFKFNGKKYTAKTNKKGVAKITIKKKILKKLKKGKKVKYEVSYGKHKATKKVKVIK